MSSDDLRPRPTGQQAPADLSMSGGKRWWDPLATKWGILSVLIVMGLAVGLYEDMVTRFFRGTEEAARARSVPTGAEIIAEETTRRAETAKLDASGVAELLWAALFNLPGETPERNYERATRLASQYALKWHAEEKAKRATMSSFAYDEVLKRQKDAAQKLWSEAMQHNAETLPARPAVMALLKYMQKVHGEHVETVTQELVTRIRWQAKAVEQLPLLRREIEAYLEQGKTADALIDKARIQGEITKRVTAYVAAERFRTGFPSAVLEPRLDQKRRDASSDLHSAVRNSVTRAPDFYTTGARAVMASLPYATANEINSAVGFIITLNSNQ